MRTVVRTIVMLIAVLGTAAPVIADVSEDSRLMLEEGQRLFQEASNTEEEAVAQDLYRKALDRFEYVVEADDVHNGRLFYNMANGYYRLGEIGRAVLYYRRAELLRPADANVRHNLSEARSQRLDRLPTPQEASLSRALFFWHYLISARARVYVFAAAFAGAWVLAGVYLLRRRRRFFTGALVAAAVAVLFFASIAAHGVALSRADEGVITVEEVTARKGDGIAYQSSFVDPLHAGTEFRVIERRADWYHIELTDGRRTWIPADAATLIGPLAP